MTNEARHLAETIHGISRLAESVALNPQLGYSSVIGNLTITDGDGNVIGTIGDDGKGGIGSKPWRQTPAPMPTTPEATADAGFIRVKWDGLWADAEDPRLPADPSILTPPGTDLIEVHVSTDPNFAPSRVRTFAGTFSATGDGGSLIVGPLIESGEYWVALRARMSEGHVGELSGKTPIEVSGVQLDSKLFELALRDDEIRKAADGKNEVFYGDEEPEPRPVLDQEGNPVYDEDGNQLFEEFNENDLWFGPGNMPHLFDEETGEWVSAGDARVKTIEDAQDQLRKDLDEVIVDGSGMKSFYRPTMPTDAESSEGDLWYDTSVDGKNVPHLYENGEWVSVADARVKAIQDAQDELASEVTDAEARAIAEAKGLAGEALEAANDHTDNRVFDSTQIADDAITTPKLKAGAVGAAAIAAEAIEGRHVKAGSLTADKVLIGQGGNLLSNPEFIADGEGWSESPNIAEGAGKDGSNALLIRESTSNNGHYLGVSDSTAKYRFSVTPGEEYRFSAYATSEEGIPKGDARMYVRFYTRADIAEGTYTWGSPSTISNSAPIEGFSWGQIDGIITAPEGAVEAALGLYSGPGHPTIMRWSLPSAQPAVNATLIKDGSVTTGKMAAGSITAESGIIGSLDAGTILFGEMDGARIKARSISASKLLIGATSNMLPGADGNWPGGNAGWSQFEKSGDSLRVKGSKTVHNDDEFFLQAGEYQLEVSVNATVANTSCYVQLEGVGYGPPKWVPSKTAWTRFTASIEVPKDIYTRLEIFANYSDGASNNNGYQYFKDLSLRSKAGATLIQDGAITTDKIATGAITAESGIIGSLDAGVITTGELRGELIRANSIAGSKLAATAIDGKTITGALIRTAAAGARVETDKYGLWQYNSFNQVIASMEDGKFTAVGDFQTGMDGERRVVISNRQFANAVGIRFYPDGTGSEAGITSMAGNSWTPGSLTVTSATAGSLNQQLIMGAPTSSDYGYSYLGTINDGDYSGGSLLVNEDGSAELRSRRSKDLRLWSSGDVDIDSDAAVSVLARDGSVNIESKSGDVRLAPHSSGKLDLYFPGNSDLRTTNLNQLSGSGLREVVMDGQWNIGYNVSSRRYKIAEEPIQETVNNLEDRLLSVDSKTWFSRSAAENYAAYLEEIEREGESELDPMSGGELRRIPGVIAEDLHAAGLGILVFYNEDGEPDGVNYDGIGPALIPIVRNQRDRITDLETRLAKLEAA